MNLNTSQKWLLALSVAVVLFVGGIFFMKVLIEHRINQLSEEKINAPNRFEFGALTTTIIPGRLILEDVDLDYEFSSIGQRLEMKAPSIRFDGVSWLRVVLFKELDVDHLQFDQPRLTLINLPAKDTTAVAGQSADSKGLSSLRFSTINLNGGQLKVLNNQEDSLAAVSADTLNIDLQGIALHLEKDDTPWEVEHAECTLVNCLLRETKGKGLYRYIVNRIHLSKNDSLIRINGFSMKPNYGKKAFTAQLDKKQTRLDLTFPLVELSGWQFDRILKGQLAARVLRIDSLAVDAYNNSDLPVDKNKKHPLPHELLLTAKLGILLDSIVVSNSSVHYEEFTKGKHGNIWFDPLDGTITNVTNDSVRISNQNLMEIVIKAGFQKQYATTHRFWMDLSSPNYAFTFKGNTGSMPFEAFNSFTRPLASVILQEGTLRKLKYDANADENAASGNLELIYDELDFVMLNEKNKKAKLKSEIAQLLMVSDDNLKDDDDFKIGQMQVSRDPTHSFFKYWWSAIETGIRSTMRTDFAENKLNKGKNKKGKRKKR